MPTERQRFVAQLVLEHAAELVREAAIGARADRYASIATEGILRPGGDADRFGASLSALGVALQRCAEDRRAAALEEWITEWIAP